MEVEEVILMMRTGFISLDVAYCELDINLSASIKDEF
jgi:hypothetical protein